MARLNEYTKMSDKLITNVNGLLSDIKTDIIAHNENRKKTAALIDSLKSKQDNLSHFMKLDVDIDELLSASYLTVRFGSLPKDAYKQLKIIEEDGKFIFTPCSSDDHTIWGVYCTPKKYEKKVDEIFASLYFEKLTIDMDDGTVAEIIKKNADKIEELSEQLDVEDGIIKRTWDENSETILNTYSLLLDLQEIYKLRKYAAVNGESFYYVGSKDNMTAAHKTATWTAEGANVWNTLVGNNAKGFVAGNGGVAEFDDNTQQTTASSHNFNTLLAATSQRLYANVSGKGLMSAPVDDLTTDAWTAEPVSEDDNMAQLPTKGLASATLPLSTNSDSRYVVVVGHNDGEAYSSVWAKVEEDGQNKQQWMQYPYDDNDNRLPAFDNLQMGVYNGRIVALGHNNGQQTAKMYRSEDHGLTWQADTCW